MHLSAKPTSKWPFFPGTPKGEFQNYSGWTPTTLHGHNFLLKPPIGWGLKQSCNSHWELSNGVSHSICTHGSWIDSRLFVVRRQTTSLTPDLSFCHNLCCRCLNGSCEPILDIYTSIVFQWYKLILNVRCFDLCNCSMKVRDSIGTPTPKRRTHWGVWVFILTLFLASALETLLPWSWA